ncbi:pseudouridine synthase [Paremcibacter congregatus]|uniref:pseudouridine synthase n=1 Tax=Paremcibacter congregatus TaxID=2043170 RepID=UPI003A936773
MTDETQKPATAGIEPQDAPAKGERIAKMLARAGVGSRRAVERMIEAGMVKQGDRVIDTPATLITSVEGITVDGQKVNPPEPTKIWLYHKPAGRVTTYFDPDGRPTVFEALPANMPRVLSVGRLDLNTEGLLLLTNDGELSRWLELPSTGWLRTYKVRCHGYFDRDRLAEIRRGLTIDDVKYRGVKIDINESREKSNLWLTIAIREGKNREVRKLLEYIGLQVTRLIRLSYGPFELKEMARGTILEVPTKDTHLHCAEYFKDKGIEAPGGVTAEKPSSRPAKERQGWAKAKPKTNNRRANKKRTDPKRFEEDLPKKVRGNRPSTPPRGKSPATARAKTPRPTGKK